ncbi:MAG: hypothetical protein HKN70_09180 [Gammaproteobacteria bacterium]|nr:hypothetical protein [Gammaproteobacteria bacterium]
MKFIFTVLAILFFYFIVERITGRALILDADHYRAPLLLPGIADRFGPGLLLLAGVGLIALAVIGKPLTAWQQLDSGQLLRQFILMLAVVIAWPLTTYGYNHYLDQAHAFDRAALLLCLLGLIWRPIFVLPFLIIAYGLLGQLIEPALGGTIIAHKTQVLRVLELFAAAFIVFALSGFRNTRHFVFLACCFVAAGYWIPAVAKLQLDWLSGNRIDFVPVTAYAHGWLGHLEPRQIVEFSKQLLVVNGPARFAVIILETAFLVFLFGRFLSYGLLLGAIVFHLCVFALFGFFFWTWIALDAALLYLLIRYYGNAATAPWARSQLWLSVALIGFGTYWAKPPALGWYETPLAYTYRIEAGLDNGETATLHPRFFAPYEDVFTMASFSYLTRDHARLVSAYGVTRDKSIKEALAQAQTAADVFALENQRNDVAYNPLRVDKFRYFLSEFIQHRNHNGDSGSGWYTLHSPLQFWSLRNGRKILADRKIRNLSVKEVTYFYNGETLETIREIEVLTMAIPPPATTVTED